jgi:hypothetical protein
VSSWSWDVPVRGRIFVTKQYEPEDIGKDDV